MGYRTKEEGTRLFHSLCNIVISSPKKIDFFVLTSLSVIVWGPGEPNKVIAGLNSTNVISPFTEDELWPRTRANISSHVVWSSHINLFFFDLQSFTVMLTYLW